MKKVLILLALFLFSLPTISEGEGTEQPREMSNPWSCPYDLGSC